MMLIVLLATSENWMVFCSQDGLFCGDKSKLVNENGGLEQRFRSERPNSNQKVQLIKQKNQIR